MQTIVAYVFPHSCIQSEYYIAGARSAFFCGPRRSVALTMLDLQRVGCAEAASFGSPTQGRARVVVV